MTERVGCSESNTPQDDAHGPMQQARDVIASYEEQRVYVNGRAATSTEIVLAREVVRLSAQSESGPIPGAKIAMRLKQQRDECAEALRGLVAVVESNFPMPAGVHPGSPLDKARKALADVPTYEQQLRNIFEGMADEK